LPLFFLQRRKNLSEPIAKDIRDLWSRPIVAPNTEQRLAEAVTCVEKGEIWRHGAINVVRES
jgi:hypothetical protein